VLGDRIELRRVITNLLGNALKFTDAGSVTVRLLTNSNSVKRTAIKLEIEDTGPGIPISDQAKLFESFITGSHRRSGSGLGLHLSRQIVEAHQGQIYVKSDVGKGSLFTVYLPLQA
jgi:signal transduction histidine kinase